MSVDNTIQRPLTTTTESELIQLEAVLIEDTANGLFTVDFKGNIGGNDRLYARVNITPTYSGTNLNFDVQSQNFLGQAANTYADSKASPFTDLDSDSSSKKVSVSGTDLHTFHIAAGDPTAS